MEEGMMIVMEGHRGLPEKPREPRKSVELEAGVVYRIAYENPGEQKTGGTNLYHALKLEKAAALGLRFACGPPQECKKLKDAT